jgi:hypothetical protein
MNFEELKAELVAELSEYMAEGEYTTKEIATLENANNMATLRKAYKKLTGLTEWELDAIFVWD